MSQATQDKRSGQWSNEHRMEAARARTRQARRELLAFVGMLTRMYEAHRCRAQRPQDERFSTVVCVHTPCGQLAWKLAEDEAGPFAHLPMRDNDWDRSTQGIRIERLNELTPAIK